MNALVKKLENLLVEEYQACQALYEITRQERQALSANHVEELERLVEKKEGLLDEINRLEESRRAAVQQAELTLGLKDESALALWIGEREPEAAGRIQRLREGILAVMSQARELSHGSGVLAAAALERSARVQEFLLSLYQPPDQYGPTGARDAGGYAPSIEIDQRK